jgi:hypothetical protein
LGLIDLAQVDEKTLNKYQTDSLCIVGHSLDEVKHRVNQITPRLIEEDYHGFGIVQYGGQYYALDHALGPVDLTQIEIAILKEYQACHMCMIAASLTEVIHQVDQLHHRNLQKETEKQDKHIENEIRTKNLKSQVDEKDERIIKLQKVLQENEAKINTLEAQLEKIKSSRWHRLLAHLRGQR